MDLENEFKIGFENSTVNVEMNTTAFFELIETVSHANLAMGREYDSIRKLEVGDNPTMIQFKEERMADIEEDLARIERFLMLQHLI